MKTPKEEYRYGIEVLMYDNTIDDNRVCFFGVGQQFAFKAPKDYCGIGTICNYTPVDSTGEYGDVSRETLIDGHSYVVRYDGMDEHANEIIRAVDLNEQGEDSGKDALGGKIMNCLLIFALQMSMTASVMANEWTDPNTKYIWEYEVTNDGACLTKGTDSKGTIVIPSELGGFPVAEIGANAFRGCDNFSEVTIPASVTNINSGAFCFCRKLSTISIPANVQIIGAGAFEGCCTLGKLDIAHESMAKIEATAFSDCTNLTSITLPYTVMTNCWFFTFRQSNSFVISIVMNDGTVVKVNHSKFRELEQFGPNYMKALREYVEENAQYQKKKNDLNYKFPAHTFCDAHPALYKEFCAGASEAWCKQKEFEMRENDERCDAVFKYDKKLGILTCVVVIFDSPGVSVEALEAKYKKNAKGKFWKKITQSETLVRWPTVTNKKIYVLSMGDDEVSVSGEIAAGKLGKITIRSCKLDAALAERDRQENEAKARAEADAARKKESEALNF